MIKTELSGLFNKRRLIWISKFHVNSKCTFNGKQVGSLFKYFWSVAHIWTRQQKTHIHVHIRIYSVDDVLSLLCLLPHLLSWLSKNLCNFWFRAICFSAQEHVLVYIFTLQQHKHHHHHQQQYHHQQQK